MNDAIATRLHRAESLVAEGSIKAAALANEVLADPSSQAADVVRALTILARHARRTAAFSKGYSALLAAAELSGETFALSMVGASLLMEEGDFRSTNALLENLRATARSADELAEIEYETALAYSHPHNPGHSLLLARHYAESALRELEPARPRYAYACAQLIAFSCVEDPDTSLSEAAEAVERLNGYPTSSGTYDAANDDWITGLLARKAGNAELSLRLLKSSRETFAILGMPKHEGMLYIEICISGLTFGRVKESREAAFESFRLLNQIGRQTEAAGALILLQRAVVQERAEAIALARIARRKMLENL